MFEQNQIKFPNMQILLSFTCQQNGFCKTWLVRHHLFSTIIVNDLPCHVTIHT